MLAGLHFGIRMLPKAAAVMAAAGSLNMLWTAFWRLMLKLPFSSHFNITEEMKLFIILITIFVCRIPWAHQLTGNNEVLIDSNNIERLNEILNNNKKNTIFTFKSDNYLIKSTIILKNMSNVVLNFNQSSITVLSKSSAISIIDSYNLKINGLLIDYQVKPNSIGEVSSVNEKIFFANKSKNKSNDRIYQLIEILDGKITRDSKRFHFGADSRTGKYISDGVYDFTLAKVPPGKYIAVHSDYGPPAIAVYPSNILEYGSGDISISDVEIKTSFGFGIHVVNLNGDFLLENSKIYGSLDGIISWDGVHISSFFGRIYIKNNTIGMIGDDAINIGSPFVSAKKISPGKYHLKKKWHYVKNGDEISAYGADGVYLGDYYIDYKNKIANINLENDPDVFYFYLKKYAGGSFYIEDNTIADCSCHAVLAQVGSGYIKNNIINNINRNAIRLRGGSFEWGEGASLDSVIVSGNKINKTGVDYGPGKWGVIRVYGDVPSLMKNINIKNNNISDFKNKCISFDDYVDVKMEDNLCVDD